MIDPSEFTDIIQELERHPIEHNKYRSKSGEGRTQIFGIINRRGLTPDYSSNCWIRPYLYKLLLDFAKKHVTIPYNAITITQNHRASIHKDRGVAGISYNVAFGDYKDGELEIQEGTFKGIHNIKYIPFIADFSKDSHQVRSFTGNRYSLTFYQLSINKKFKNLDIIPCSIEKIDDGWIFKKGDEIYCDTPSLRRNEIYIEYKKINITFD